MTSNNNFLMNVERRSRAGLIFCATVLAFAFTIAIPSAVAQENGAIPPNQSAEDEEAIREALKGLVDKLSFVPSMIVAEELGLTEIQGRPIDERSARQRLEFDISRLRAAGAEVPSIATNVPIAVHPTKHENEPTVVANPQDESKLVAGSHFFGPPAPTGNRCLAFTSSDGGMTWSPPFEMPQLTPASQCSDPVLAYAPDGNRVYYAYMDIKPGNDFDIVVSFSDNDGATWTGPIVVLNGVTTGPIQYLYDKPWIGTHVDVPGPQGNNVWVYVTATQFRLTGPIPDNAIAFSRSSNSGATWPATAVLLGGGFTGTSATGFEVVQGSRPIGGLGSNVLVAWYYSGLDGWGPGVGGGGSFNTRTVHSSNFGGAFGLPVNAATDSFETRFFLGPFDAFARWWPAMMPDVEIDTSGVAHIVYTHDPVTGFTSAEDGNIRYVSSAGPPYNVWTAPVTISDDPTGQAQGMAALETIGGTQHVIFQDSRLSPFPAANIFYDIFYTTNDGTGWTANERVTDMSSINDFSFFGDYIDITTGPTLKFGVWTDRRDKISIFDFEDDVWGAIIP